MIVFVFITACASVNVKNSKCDTQDLKEAEALMLKQLRPLPAERKIQHVITKSIEDNNQVCLAQAYRLYGFFFRSSAVEKWQSYYTKNGFIDTTAQYDKRLFKSAEYFEKAIAIYLSLNDYNDALSNLYFNLGVTYESLNELEKAEMYYTESLAYHKRSWNKSSNQSYIMPKKYHRFEQFINDQINRVREAK